MPTIDDAPSPRVPEFDTTPRPKVFKRQDNKIKRLSSPKEIKKTKSNFINSSTIATRTRSQVNSKQNPTSIDSHVAGLTRSKLAMIANKVNLIKVLKIVLADFVIERTNQIAIANAVLDQETGQIMEHHHLITHKNPKIRAI